MFAIEITEENMPKILESKNLSEYERVSVELYLSNKGTWYFVTGYSSLQGWNKDWSVLPANVFNSNFEYDPEKIKTDWDQIVRK